jgi:hypothetical protein
MGETPLSQAQFLVEDEELQFRSTESCIDPLPLAG